MRLALKPVPGQWRRQSLGVRPRRTLVHSASIPIGHQLDSGAQCRGDRPQFGGISALSPHRRSSPLRALETWKPPVCRLKRLSRLILPIPPVTPEAGRRFPSSRRRQGLGSAGPSAGPDRHAAPSRRKGGSRGPRQSVSRASHARRERLSGVRFVAEPRDVRCIAYKTPVVSVCFGGRAGTHHPGPAPTFLSGAVATIVRSLM